VKELKTKNRDAQKKRSGHKVRGVSHAAGKIWWERFVKEVGFEPEVKERGSYDVCHSFFGWLVGWLNTNQN